MARSMLLLLPLYIDSAAAARREALWDAGWKFHRGLCPVASPAGIEACASPTLDDGGWRSLDLPHDWSREDLPARDVDTEFPVIDARYGAWKLHAGDNASWAAAYFDDSSWGAATGGADWRSYGAAFGSINATGWYRQTLGLVPGFMLSTNRTLTLSLGVIAGADSTYVNGVSLGMTPPKSCSRGHGCVAGGNTLGTRLYIEPRAYAIPEGLLHPPGGPPNVLAVRVLSYGGSGHGPANATNMSDSKSFPPFGTSFPGGLYDDPNLKAGAATARIGPFDAAISPGTMATGYTVGGTGYYRKTFVLGGAVGSHQKVFLRFDGVYMNSDVFLNGHWLGNHPYG